MRLFVGVPLEGEAAQAAGVFIQGLKPSFPAVRWVAPANLHLTLRFIGDVAEEQLPEVERWFVERLAGVEPGALVVTGTGCFKNRDQTVLWLGVEESGWIARAAAQLGTRVANTEAEQRAFAAHITVGRQRESHGRRPATAAPEVRSFAQHRFGPVRQKDSHIVLFRSRLSGSGAIYQELKQWPVPGG